jgi:hypothetical protein
MEKHGKMVFVLALAELREEEEMTGRDVVNWLISLVVNWGEISMARISSLVNRDINTSAHFSFIFALL